MRTVAVLASVVGMLLGGTYAIRDAGLRGQRKVCCKTESAFLNKEKGTYPDMPDALQWWEEQETTETESGASSKTSRPINLGAGETTVTTSNFDDETGVYGDTKTKNTQTTTLIKPGNLVALGEGEGVGGEQNKAREEQIKRQIAKMRRQIRRQLELAMRNARIPPDARADIRILAGQLFERITDIRIRAANGEIPKYQVRQEMRTAWRDFSDYVNQRLDNKQQRLFWREWEYARNPQKRLYDMQRQLQDVQKKMSKQGKQMQRFLRRQPPRKRPRQRR